MSTVIESLEKRDLKQRPKFGAGRPRARSLPGGRGQSQEDPGLRGDRHQAAGQRRPRDLHCAEAVFRCRCRANIPAALAEDREARNRGSRRCTPRAKLYYLRDKVGKSARVAERRWGIEDDVLVAEDEAEATDAEGVAVSEAEAELVEPPEEEGDAEAAEGEDVFWEEQPAEEQAARCWWGRGGGEPGAGARGDGRRPRPKRQKTQKSRGRTAPRARSSSSSSSSRSRSGWHWGSRLSSSSRTRSPRSR